MDFLRLFVAAALALSTAVVVDRRSRARGLGPPWDERPERRALGLGALTLVFFTLFLGLVYVDVAASSPAPEVVDPGALFLLQALLVVGLIAWYGCGWGRAGVARAVRELGLRARRPLEEVSLGVGLGIPAWAIALGTTTAVAAIWGALGGATPDFDQQGVARVAAVARLPVMMRLAISASAGLFEEVFFRGFLQRRIGILASSALFVVAHVGYGEPFLLVGVTVLSFLYAGIVRWRRNIWAAVVAHFLFDAVQLLVLIPWVLRQVPVAGG